eukprot:CAMPEP_0202709912 /NCGR_PEP_ID=MMETSP1385-20130828/21964_1 /ASSEMBLY_ACC=CAM_ASM_000861 /TAXON_ID=933848 /ORGANISM="Elphidium margaritaceum" /LENGTH=1545 /DNA_ID=CAMNT_0049369297 /DNA_START=38 /DNA_END=4675 /DNA_ORIENTATION=-
MKRHQRLVEYFITVGIEFESVAPINDDSISNPIRALRIVSEKECVPDGYERITTTVTGRDASLTKKGMMNRSSRHYLCYTRDPDIDQQHNSLFTRVQYVRVKDVAADWTKVPGPIMNGKTEYRLCTKNDHSMPPVADICLITMDGKESCPAGYFELGFTINALAICLRLLPMDALDLRYQTCILDRYPRTDYANSPLSNTVAVFCQPSGADIRLQPSMPTFLSFVLTDSEGRKMYAITVTFYDKLEEDEEHHCKRALELHYTEGFRPAWPDKEKSPRQLYHSKSVCILSYYPFFLSFREALKEIYRLANSPGKIPIERYIINLCEETPLPIPSKCTVRLLYAHKPIVFRIPNEDELPLLDSNIKKIFCCLHLSNVLRLFKFLMTQKYKILFTSSHVSLITEICEGLTSFMQPFEWQFTYVPVLPYSVFGILDAPVPVLVGMHSSRLRPDFYSDPEKELIIVDLDNNTLHVPPHCESIEVPPHIYKSLKADLKLYAKADKVELFDKESIKFVDSAFNVQISHDDMDDAVAQRTMFNAIACRAAFYKFWIKLMGPSYMHFVQRPEYDDIMDIDDMFDIDGFIGARPKNIRKFWRQFCETQAFQKFVEDLTFTASEDRSNALTSFWKCCQYEYKMEENLDAAPTVTPNSPNKQASVSGNNVSLSSLSLGRSDSNDVSQSPSTAHNKTMIHSTKLSSDHLNANNNNSSSLMTLSRVREGSAAPVVDVFTEYLKEKASRALQAFQVPQANEADLDESYKFEVSSAFPVMAEKFMIAARAVDLSHMYDAAAAAADAAEEDAKHSSDEVKQQQAITRAARSMEAMTGEDKGPKILINDEMPTKRPTHRRQNSKRSGSGAGKQHQSPMDRAKHLLLQVYGAWFAVHVASLDFRDIPGDEVENVVTSTLNVLYRMSDERLSSLSSDVQVAPDELIYKACLILCGKFGKKKEASKLFKDLKKNGITPSQKTYGAYTNAMASSGANMLLSAQGSTSSGASGSTKQGRSHRSSFASLKARSLSAAVNPNKRLHSPHKIRPISEDNEDQGLSHGFTVDSPVSLTTAEDEFRYIARSMSDNDAYVGGGNPQSSQGKEAVVANGATATTEEQEEEEQKEKAIAKQIADEMPITKVQLMTMKSSPVLLQSTKHSNSNGNVHHTAQLHDSMSSPTASPQLSDASPVLNGGSGGSIKQHVWKDANYDDEDDENEAKQSQPNPTSTANTTTTNTTTNTSTTTYSTPSVLSSPESVKEPAEEKQEKITTLINYSTLRIESKHACKCGYVLSDAQIMVGWFSEYNGAGALQCIMCTQNSFEPKLYLRYDVSKFSTRGGIKSFDTVDKCVDYISPIQLRTRLNFILQHRRLDFEDPEQFRTKHEDEFWNMIWYFYHRQLDLSFLLGYNDAAQLQIKPMSSPSGGKDKDALEPTSDDELLAKLQPIYNKATNNQMREAISEWLVHRSQTPAEQRERSIWNLSVFDSFHDLQVAVRYDSYDAFISAFKNACRSIRPKIKDRAWQDPALAIQHCFKHPRISNRRLQQMTLKLTGKPQRPQQPVPLPPSKK